MSVFDFPPHMQVKGDAAQEAVRPIFDQIEQIVHENTRKVLDAFHKHNVSETFFAGTTGYGLNDRGRDALDDVFATIFRAEAALVRIGLVSGTHAITAALFAMLKPGQTLLSITGTPYDTLHSVVGLNGNHHGTLPFYGILLTSGALASL